MAYMPATLHRGCRNLKAEVTIREKFICYIIFAYIRSISAEVY